MRLESPEKFQQLCASIARLEYPDVMPLASASWDGGCDVIRFIPAGKKNQFRNMVWQVKFTKDLGSNTKKSILSSIHSLKAQSDETVRRWILCLPVDPTSKFLEWLSEHIPPEWKAEVWGSSIINEKLGSHPQLIHTYFYALYEDIRRMFSVENLELVRFQLDPECEWIQPDPLLLLFAIGKNVQSPDFVLDVIVRNTGSIDAVLLGVQVDISDWSVKLHGLPGTGLLFPQVEYVVPIGMGAPGRYYMNCEPPLIVRHGGVERFMIRLTDTGYAWRGTVQISLKYSTGLELKFPHIRLHA
jgi:hypothetical protein